MENEELQQLKSKITIRLKSGKINIKLNVTYLNKLIYYTLSDDSVITKNLLLNLKKFIGSIDTEPYKNDSNSYEILGRIEYIKKIIRLRTDYNISLDSLLEEIKIKKYQDIYDDILDNYDKYMSKMTVERIDSISRDISARIIDHSVDKFIYSTLEALQRYNDFECNDRRELAQVITDVMRNVINECREVNKNATETDLDFSLSSNLKDSIQQIQKMYKSPSHKLKSGIKMLNKMLAGGFETGRVYVVAGEPGGGKSITLLNLMHQIKTCNKIPSVNGIKNTIVMLTQENSVVETITRLFEMVSGLDSDYVFQNYDIDKIVEILQTHGQMTAKLDDELDIRIIFRSNLSISTQDLEMELKEMETYENRKIVCLFHDYIERIKSSNYTDQYRLELGNIINDFKVLAKRFNMPVITACQLNREGCKILSDSRASSTTFDILLNINSAHVGESQAIVKNADVVLAIAREEVSETGKTYFGFNAFKKRTKNKVNYFAHPVDDENGIRLVPDIDIPLQKLSITSIKDTVFANKVGMIEQVTKGNNIQAVSKYQNDFIFNKTNTGTSASTEDIMKSLSGSVKKNKSKDKIKIRINDKPKNKKKKDVIKLRCKNSTEDVLSIIRKAS